MFACRRTGFPGSRVGPPSPPPVQPQRGAVGLTGLDLNELTKRPIASLVATILAQVPRSRLVLLHFLPPATTRKW